MGWSWILVIDGKRSGRRHECRRGTHECVRHEGVKLPTGCGLSDCTMVKWIKLDLVRNIVIFLAVMLAGCSSPPADTPKKTGPVEPTSAVPIEAHPLAKYVELVGFRLSEAGGRGS